MVALAVAARARGRRREDIGGLTYPVLLGRAVGLTGSILFRPKRFWADILLNGPTLSLCALDRLLALRRTASRSSPAGRPAGDQRPRIGGGVLPCCRRPRGFAPGKAARLFRYVLLYFL